MDTAEVQDESLVEQVGRMVVAMNATDSRAILRMDT